MRSSSETDLRASVLGSAFSGSYQVTERDNPVRFVITYDGQSTGYLYADGAIIAQTTSIDASSWGYEVNDQVLYVSRWSGGQLPFAKAKGLELLPYAASAAEVASWGAPK